MQQQQFLSQYRLPASLVFAWFMGFCGSYLPLVLLSFQPTRCPFCLQVLVYLWRVHGIDYYGGREYTNPAEPGRAAARRTQRGPKPSEADMAAAAAAAAETEAGGAAVEDGAEPAAAVADDAVKPEGEAAADGTAAEAAAEVGEAAAADGDEAAGDAAAAEAKSPTAAAAAAVAAAATSPKAAGSAGKQQLQLGGAGEEGREYEQRVVGFWRFRLEKGDPLEMPLHRQQVRLRLQLPQPPLLLLAPAGGSCVLVGASSFRLSSFPPSLLRGPCPLPPAHRLRRMWRSSWSPRSSRLRTTSGATSCPRWVGRPA
jgi:hypothetical protein